VPTAAAEPWLSQNRKQEIVNLCVLQVPKDLERACNLFIF